jgi:ABC-2 type transport system permease protein
VTAVVAACLRRDLTIARSYRLSFVLEAIAVIAGLAIFSGVGQVADGASIARDSGVQGGYFAFASVGIAVSGMLSVCCSAFAQRVREDQTTGAFEAMLASPVSPRLLVVAGAAYELLKALGLAVLTMVFAVAIFGVRLHVGGGAAVALLVGLPGLLLLLAAVGVVVAAVGVVSKDPGPLVGLATAGVSLLGGAYFPVSALPGALEAIARVLPVTWGLDALRAGLLGGDVDVLACCALVVIGVASLPVALWLFERAVDVARRRGSLAEY